MSAAEKKCQQHYDKELSQDFGNEILFLKRIHRVNFKEESTSTSLLKEILGLGLFAMFPKIRIALRIFISLPISLASSEQTCNIFKQIKNYHSSTITRQERLNELAMLNINCATVLHENFISLK